MSTKDDSAQRPLPPDGAGVSRRSFLKGAGLTAAAVGVTGPTGLTNLPQDEDAVVMLGPGPARIKLDINGQTQSVEAEPMTTLLDLIRDKLDLTGAKRVCDRGFCGACTVHVDGRAVNSCSLLAIDAVGKKITTIEGLTSGDELTPLQEAFIDCDASQCGFCTPGMIMSCSAVLSVNPTPTKEELAAGISGNLCRCGTYQNIFEAVEQVSRKGGSGK